MSKHPPFRPKQSLDMTSPPGNSSIHPCHRRGNKAGSGGPHAGFSRTLLWRSGTPSSLCSLHMGSEGPSFAHEDAALMILTGEAEVPCRGYEQEAISALITYKPCNPQSILRVSTVPRQPPRLHVAGKETQTQQYAVICLKLHGS